ncbi:MAG: AAA-like domain-containing protein [Gammaproteobacteria bacterium]
MTATQRNSKYYVVGGPVQASRNCYVLRESDMTLYTRLSEGEYSHVLAPPRTGKTSLMAHTANRMRADGARVATVDLANISSRDMSADVGRWYYSFAYRICRELRIRSDMLAWWQERSGLTNVHRLREFFVDVVLAETEERVVVFIDRIEAALGRPFARALLTAGRACHDARATAPDYERLTFAMLGSASVGQFVPGGHDSPFDVSVDIELSDFTLTEVRQLAPGLACDQQTARAVSERVWYWTNGHPYLTQKVFRALTRQPAELLTEETVDEVVGQLFIARDGPRDEPHLTAIGKQLLRESPGKNARLTLYRRIRKGRRVALESREDVHRDLLRSGVVTADEDNRFTLRNRVYEYAFTPQWVSHNRPFGWRGIATLAIVALVIVGGPIWYIQFLPDPYVRLLTKPDQDYVTALEAYRRLEFLPGYGEMADQLFTEYLAGKSRNARNLREVQGFSDRLSDIPGREALGDVLLGEFWDRRTMTSMHRGDRDEALLSALRALETPTGERRRLVAELYGRDYPGLLGSIRPTAPLRALEVDRASGLLTLLDKEHRIDVWHVPESGPRRIQRFELLAEELIPLQRRLVYQPETGGGRLELTVVTDHTRPSDVEIDLRAPSGRQVTLGLPAQPADGGRYTLDSRANPELAALLEEDLNGTWSANFSDVVQGVGGILRDWSVVIGGTSAEPPPGIVPEATPIPESRIARQIVSVLAPGGRRALTWPSDPTVRGDILVWNVAGGEILARIPRPANFSGARFARGQSGVFITARNNAELWDIERVEMSLSMTIEPSFVPVMSENGYILIVDTVLEEGDDALTVWDLEKPAELGSLVTGTVADVVAADSTGRYMAVSDGERLVRLWSVGEGALLREFDHAARPVSVHFDPSGRWLVTEDAAHYVRIWSVEQSGEPVVMRQASGAWSVSISGDAILIGSLGRGFELLTLPRGESQGERFHHGVPLGRGMTDSYVAPTALAADSGFAATSDGREAVKLWRLPPSLQSGAARPGEAPRSPVAAPSIAAAISSNGRQIALATNAGDVRILATDQQALLLPDTGQAPGFIGHLDRITRTVFDASGTLVASGSFDGSVRVWEAASGAPRNFFSNHDDGAIHDLVFTPDGRHVVSATRGSVIVTDAVSGRQIARTQIQGERPQLATSADGSRVYVAADRGGLTRWLWRGDISESLIGPDSGIRRAAVNADESVIVTVDHRRRVVAWDADTMHARGRTVRAPAPVDYLYVAPDNSQALILAGVWLQLLSLSADGLAHQVTRRLDYPPAAIAPADFGLLASVVTRSHASKPEVTQIILATPNVKPLEQDLEQFVPLVETSLSLRLNDWGDPQPIR